MTRVFVDTSALIALLDGDDPRQEAVRQAFAELGSVNELATHGYVVAECLAVVRRRLGVEATIALLDDVLPSIETLSVEPAMHAHVLRQYRASLPSGTSFVDWVSLAVIERDGIATALALDSDLARPGLTLLPQ